MSQSSGDSFRGLGFALCAYFLWGFLPLYMKLLSHVGAAEVVAHRIIWSVPVAGGLLVMLGRTRELWAPLCNPRMLAMGADSVSCHCELGHLRLVHHDGSCAGCGIGLFVELHSRTG